MSKSDDDWSLEAREALSLRNRGDDLPGTLNHRSAKLDVSFRGFYLRLTHHQPCAASCVYV